MTNISYQTDLFRERMQSEGLPEIFIKTFANYYNQLLEGKTGLIRESEIEPVKSLPDADSLPPQFEEVGEAVLAKTTIIKLNGGLGTSMGLDQAKSLLLIKESLSFLKIIARQALSAGIPLTLMNSFVTHDDSMEALKWYSKIVGNRKLAFLQHKQPKINKADLFPITWPPNPEYEWCPPGHGDIYTALVTNGLLDEMIANGYEYAFISNSDNLGAVIDKRILGYFSQNEFPFMMEVADRTEMDKKGGHLALRLNGQMILRESAQTAPEDQEAFQDINRYKYFNTNNLWLNLPSLQSVMKLQNNNLGLPMIRNIKTVDPRDESSPEVYQLETAMGSAIGVFEGAQAIRVPRSRFAPVKKTDDLLAIRSDAYILTDEYHVIPNPERQLAPLKVDLDMEYFKFVKDLDKRFPHGPPSLVNCASLQICGDFKFGRDVVCNGDVSLVNDSGKQVVIQDGSFLSGNLRF